MSATTQQEPAGLLPRATEASIDLVRKNCPPDLLALPAWVCSSREPETAADGTVKSSKRPIDPKTGSGGKSNNPATWGTIDQAAAYELRHGNVFGVGINLLGSEFVGLDLDHVISKTTGEVNPSAQLLLDTLPPTYVERSPSGDGFRVFLRGRKPASMRGCKWSNAFGPGTALEAYDGVGGGRYLTVTGNVWSDEPIATVCDDDLDALQEWTKPQPSPQPTAVKMASYGPDPQRDLQRAEFALQVLPQALCDGYHEWLRVGAALKPLGDAGLALWRTWSRGSAKFQEGECERKWDGLRGTSFATLAWLANQADPSWRQRAAEAAGSHRIHAQATEQEPRAAAPKPPRRPTAPWPAPLGREARIGVLGELLDAVELQTEADPAAIAFDFLARLGNAVNRGPHFQIEADRHACNLFVAVVGDTGQGRKGTSAGYPRAVMKVADPIWTEQCCRGGLSSGEGVIWAVRDPMQVGSDKKTGEPILDPGVTDKRVLLFEPELARTLRAAGRRDSTLSTILRQAWEGSPLAAMTKAPYRATGAHVSLIAHVTPTELASLLQQDDVAGGTVNRFLFVCSRRQRELPYGGQVGQPVIETMGQRVAECIEIARKHASVFPFDPEANQAWPDHYHALLADEKAHGLKGQVLGRAVAQTRRLAMLLAICDGSTSISPRHVAGALELWRYSRDSALRVFGDSTGNRIADRILGELRGLADAAEGGDGSLSRTAIYKLFDSHVTKDKVNEALDLLLGMSLAKPTRVATAGRPSEIWTVV